MMNKLGADVKFYRISKNMTQQELASAVGYVHKTSVSNIEKGKVDLPLSMVSKLSEVLGVDEVKLLYGMTDSLSPHEYEVIESYRQQPPEVQEAVDRILLTKKIAKNTLLTVN